MNFELFLARRLSKSKLDINYYSGPITKICIIAVSISIIIMIISTGSAFGFKKNIIQNIVNLDSHIQINQIGQDEQPIHIDTTEIVKIQKIKNIYPIIYRSTIISNEQNIEGIILKGIPKSYKKNIIKNHIIKGQELQENNENEILISSKHAKKLKLQVNDYCILYFMSKNKNIKKRKFLVSGIYDMNNEEFNEVYAFTKIEFLQKINQWESQKYSNYEIILNDNVETNKMVHKINKLLPYNLIAQSIQTRFPGIFHWINLFDKNMFFILIIMSTICLINMTNALLIIVLERIKMIGVLKSYGCSHKSIMKIFLYKSWEISGKGLLYGNLIGLAICLIQQKTHLIKLNSASYFVNYLPVYLDFEFIIIMNILVFIIIHLSLIIPYYIVQKISPSNILKIN